MKTSILQLGLNASLLFFSFFYCLNINSQIVSTLAGSTSGYADGTGINAQFKGPCAIAVDNNGNVFVADRLNNRIRKITPAGVVTTFAGSGVAGYLDDTGTAAQFDSPMGIAVDLSGNIFVADTYNHRIRKISSSGVVTTVAGSTSGFADGVGTAAQFYYPEGVAVDNNGNLFVADGGNHRIRKISSNGTVTSLAGNSSFGYADGVGELAQFWTPIGIAIDAAGNVIVAEKQGNRIRKVTQSGVVTTVAGNGNNGYVDGVGIEAEFRAPFGVDLDETGNIYVTDGSNHRIRKITPAGVVSTYAGSSSGHQDGNALNAKFDFPIGISIASDGTMYIGESGGCKIRKITSTLNVVDYKKGISVIVYPNPVSTSINLELNDLLLYEITLFDMSGKSVLSKNNFNGENTVHIEHLKSGIYTMQITTDKGIVYKKIVKN